MAERAFTVEQHRPSGDVVMLATGFAVDDGPVQVYPLFGAPFVIATVAEFEQIILDLQTATEIPTVIVWQE